MKKEFLRCKICGNLVGMIHNGGGTLVCCNQPMDILTANTTDGAREKHVPVYELAGNTLSVTVGEVPHTMTDAHYIQWIMVTQNGHTQRIELTPECEPKAVFSIDSLKPFTVYEYCNLHGLWKAEI